MEDGAIDYSTKESDARTKPRLVGNKPQPSPWGSMAEVRGLEDKRVMTQERVLSNIPQFESWLVNKSRQNKSTYYPHIDRLVQLAVASKRMNEKNTALSRDSCSTTDIARYGRLLHQPLYK